MKKPVVYNLANSQNILAVSGEDALTFLQGQVTCDIKQLNQENSLFGALCNPKGRAISLFYIFKRSDVYYMVVPTDLSDMLFKRLKMFVFRSKVGIENVSDDFVILGSPAQNKLSELGCFVQISIQSDSNLSIIIYAKKRFEELAADNLNNISDQTQPWYQALIKAGIPRINKQTTEMFVPQMLNLELLNAISFTKGCYTGQEIIARMHYKGTLKRRMYLFNSPKALEPGADLFNKSDVNSLGNIVDCQAVDNDSYCGTVVLKSANVSSLPMQLNDGTSITIEHPPYELNTEA